MDDLIYGGLRKNIIMPVSMVSIKGSQGTVDRADIKTLGEGTKSFMREMSPHALTPSNAKELILKDADYSTPQDHYFMYVNRNKGKMDAMGLCVEEMNEDLSGQELQLIRDLYDDQPGRADAIEGHIGFLRNKRKPKTMSELYQDLSDSEIADIEANWGTSLENLKQKAMEHDKQVEYDAMPAEERRSRKHDKMLNDLNMNKVMSMTTKGRTESIEYQVDDPFAL